MAPTLTHIHKMHECTSMLLVSNHNQYLKYSFYDFTYLLFGYKVNKLTCSYIFNITIIREGIN